MPRDAELLDIEIEALWVRDERDRLVKERRLEALGAPHLVVAVSRDMLTCTLGSAVPDPLAAALRMEISAEGHPSDPAKRPASLAGCERLLRDALGPVEVSSGPSYLIPSQIAFASAVDVRRSDVGATPDLRSQDLQRLNWPAQEWRQLLDGELGAWAMATIGGEVISICHSARLTERAAEAGVWTDPRFRGRGHAAAVTAAWASLLGPTGRYLFYSTSAANLSSQRVAARLSLRPIGWLWKVSTPRS